MKNLLILLFLVVITLLPLNANSEDINLRWDASTNAIGYNIQMSTDTGLTWQTPIDVGNVLTYTYVGVPDTGLVFFRVSAYNSIGENINTTKGAWFNADWTEPNEAVGLGAQ
ncbi:MAG: hypothetical protein GY782_08460 [Gammaproteobacteria bacterium]|nr:hypothetical protein [Gammaproteobacteria bacterium]